ncbi:hypothetical protein [Bordetella ansorpii]|nr:hypothetical protein [Bordetella ansorpii]
MAYLRGRHGVADGLSLRLYAERIAARSAPAQAPGHDLLAHVADPAQAAHAALVSGFGWVMAYGAVSAFLLAGASYLVFSPARRARAAGKVCPGDIGLSAPRRPSAAARTSA